MPSALVRPVPVLLLFVGSGLAALMYEVVWLQMLQLVVGSSSISMGVLLGAFMGGMCLGSFLLPKIVATHYHPLRVYAALELFIGICGLSMLALVPLVGRVYTTWAGVGTASFAFRGLVAGICLLPPTLAMGATLPAMGRWAQSTPQSMSWLGRFYAGNTAGAVVGCVLAGFYLLRVFDVVFTTWVAVSVNVVVSVMAWGLASDSKDFGAERHVQSGYEVRSGAATPPAPNPAQDPREPIHPDAKSRRVAIYVALGLSGFCALSAEVVWTRYLSLLLGATVYAFSIILAVFLAGLGIGSAVGASLAARLSRPAIGLAVAQGLVIVAILYSAVMLGEVLPMQPGTASQTTNIWTAFLIDVRRVILGVLPAPLLWGASFPLALAALAAVGESPGAMDRDAAPIVGRSYAANALGAIAGALLTGLVLIAWVGSQRTQQILIIAAALSALTALDASRAHRRLRSGGAIVGLAVITIVAAGWAVVRVPIVPGLLVAYGRNAAAWAAHAGDIFFVGEGLQASVAVSRQSDGALNYHNAGKIQASSLPQDMRLQRMLGHLTTLVPKEARSVLVIGCGAGVTAGAVSVSPKVERVTIAEIEPLVPQVVSTHFAKVNHDVIRNPKVHVQIDDARHFLATTPERFDAITSDPLDPWVKGAAALYTKEFFELAKLRLKPGGVVTLFVQLYESSPEAVKSEIATFFEVFPHGLIFGNTFDGRAEDTILVGTVDPPYLDVDAMEAGLLDPVYADVRRSLGEIGVYSIVDLLARYAGRAVDLKPWLADAAINRDRDLRLQYLAGLGFNEHQGREIYQDLLQYRRFPDDVFIATEPNLTWLRNGIEQAPE